MSVVVGSLCCKWRIQRSPSRFCVYLFDGVQKCDYWYHHSWSLVCVPSVLSSGFRQSPPDSQCTWFGVPLPVWREVGLCPWRWSHVGLTTTLHLTTKMTTAQVVDTSVTNNVLPKYYLHPDDHAKQITDTPGFKSFTIVYYFNYTWSQNSTKTLLTHSYLPILQQMHLAEDSMSSISSEALRERFLALIVTCTKSKEFLKSPPLEEIIEKMYYSTLGPCLISWRGEPPPLPLLKKDFF